MDQPYDPTPKHGDISGDELSQLVAGIELLERREQAIRSRIVSRPHEPAAWAEYITHLQSTGRIREAVKIATQALKATRLSAEIRILLAACMAEAGGLKQAAQQIVMVLNAIEPQTALDDCVRAECSWILRSEPFQQASAIALSLREHQAIAEAKEWQGFVAWLPRFLSAGVLILGLAFAVVDVSPLAISTAITGFVGLLIAYRRHLRSCVKAMACSTQRCGSQARFFVFAVCCAFATLLAASFRMVGRVTLRLWKGTVTVNTTTDDYPALRLHMFLLLAIGVVLLTLAFLFLSAGCVSLFLWLLPSTKDANDYAMAAGAMSVAALLLALLAFPFFLARELLLVFIRIERNTRK